MKVKIAFLSALVVAMATILCGWASAQEQAPAPEQQPAPTSAQPSAIDNQGIKSYLLGPGDVINVRVFGQPDLSSTVPVDSDGNLTSLPFLETPIPAKCRTEKQVQKDIATAYSKFINNPQV